MNLKDALIGFLSCIGILVFGLYTTTIDSLPMWVLLVLAIFTFVAYIIVAIRDHQRDIKYPLLRYREAPKDPRAIPQPVYDQEEDDK